MMAGITSAIWLLGACVGIGALVAGPLGAVLGVVVGLVIGGVFGWAVGPAAVYQGFRRGVYPHVWHEEWAYRVQGEPPL